MKNLFTNKRLVLTSLFVFFLILIIAIFLFSKIRRSNFDYELEDGLIFQNNSNSGNNLQEESEENVEDDYIFVHITGEVFNCGLVKLHERCKNC